MSDFAHFITVIWLIGFELVEAISARLYYGTQPILKKRAIYPRTVLLVANVLSFLIWIIVAYYLWNT